MYEDRVEYAPLRERIMTASQAAEIIEPNTTLALSGFSVGFPKRVPPEIAALGKAHDLTLLCGAALGPDIFEPMVSAGIVKRFAAFQFDPFLQGAANSGAMNYTDVHLGLFPRKIRDGVYGKISVAVVECAKIRADGGIVPSVSVGMTNTILECAEKVILEVNEAVPLGIEGFHDIPNSDSDFLDDVSERVGETVYRCDIDKIAAVVMTNDPEPEFAPRDKSDVFKFMAENVVACINKEVDAGRLDREFTLQVGIGNVANTVLSGLGNSGFGNLKMFTEVFSGEALDMLDTGLVCQASTTCLDMDVSYLNKIFDNVDFYKQRLVLRPMEHTNGGSNIANLGVVAMNTAVEIDIYGNVNSTHVLGSKMLYGIGGSNDFARNAKLTIFLTPSTAKKGTISSIVPMVSHVDSTEHDTDIIVTEWGYADLRGLSPKERAEKIIENCVHPDYRKQLRDYYNGAVAVSGECQTPHDLDKAFSWHLRYAETGSMKEQ